MSNLAFSNQKQDGITHTVEEKLRQELGSPTPIPFTIEEGSAGHNTLGTALGDAYRTLVGGVANRLFSINFDIAQPRPANLGVNIIKQGIGSHAGSLLFSTRLAKTVESPISFDEPKTFGTSKFTGEGGAVAKLNASADLLKRLDKFARTQTNAGGGVTKAPRFVQIAPVEGGSILAINTFARPTSLGFNASMDAKEFFEIANMIEGLL